MIFLLALGGEGPTAEASASTFLVYFPAFIYPKPTPHYFWMGNVGMGVCTPSGRHVLPKCGLVSLTIYSAIPSWSLLLESNSGFQTRKVPREAFTKHPGGGKTGNWYNFLVFLFLYLNLPQISLSSLSPYPLLFFLTFQAGEIARTPSQRLGIEEGHPVQGVQLSTNQQKPKKELGLAVCKYITQTHTRRRDD